MRIKFVNVSDSFTEMQFLVLQIEESDQENFKFRKFPNGYKIIIDMNNSYISATGGMEFIPEYDDSSMVGRSRKMQGSGTTDALGLLLNSVQDIRSLPSAIDVENLRKNWLSLTDKYINIRSKLESEDIDIDNDNYKKVLYKNKDGGGMENIAIIDEKLSIVFRYSSTGKMVADYLWIPFPELEKEEFKNFLQINELFSIYTQVVIEEENKI